MLGVVRGWGVGVGSHLRWLCALHGPDVELGAFLFVDQPCVPSVGVDEGVGVFEVLQGVVGVEAGLLRAVAGLAGVWFFLLDLHHFAFLSFHVN